MKLDSDNNYNAENKRLKNVAEGTSSSDAVNKHQLTVGLNQKHDNTGDIYLKESYNIIKSKPQTFNFLKTEYDRLVSYEDVKEIFL